MYAKYEDLKAQRRDSFKGGSGGGWSRFLVAPDSGVPGSHFRMIAENTLDKGAEIGYHVHEDDDELFVIIEGRGLYSENGEELAVGPGDMLLLTRSNSHGLKNVGDGPLRLLAVIAN